jgi:hypothetical protein
LKFVSTAFFMFSMNDDQIYKLLLQ